MLRFSKGLQLQSEKEKEIVNIHHILMLCHFPDIVILYRTHVGKYSPQQSCIFKDIVYEVYDHNDIYFVSYSLYVHEWEKIMMRTDRQNPPLTSTKQYKHPHVSLILHSRL